MSNFFAELEAGFKNHADQPALILSGQDDWSYAELLLQINRAAAELAAIGAGAGDRSWCSCQNCRKLSPVFSLLSLD